MESGKSGFGHVKSGKEELAFQCLDQYVNWRIQNRSVELSPLDKGPLESFLNLPFDNWLQNTDESYDEVISAMVSGQVPPFVAIMTSIGGQYMPSYLKERLLGPSRADLDMPPLDFERRNITWDSEYKMMRKVSLVQMEDKAIATAAFKGMIACSLQCFFYQHLTYPIELTHSFNHPVAQKAIPDDRKLAIGIMRELFISPRFGSMHNFWMKHAEMIKDGGHNLGFWWGPDITANDIRAYLQNDSEATSMLDICLAIGMSETSFDISVQTLCYKFDKLH